MTGGPRGRKRVLVLSLDGTPHSLLRRRMAERPGSVWHRLLVDAPLHRIRSSRPEVSSVAWSSFLTGAQPGEHGLFGFADRAFNPFRLIYPNGSQLRLPTLAERVHEAGGTTVSINVPATFPPKNVRGLVVGGFLGTRLEANVSPAAYLESLRGDGYVIDVDPGIAHRDRERFYDELQAALGARLRVGLKTAREFDWELFHLHIMETDRLFHFYWGEPEWEERFHALLDRVDEAVEVFADVARRAGAAFVLLSDHGFTRARRIVFPNAFLKMAGLLAFESGRPPALETIRSESRVYALPPGRFFLNLRGREPMGRVQPGGEADRELDRLASLLRDLRDPLDGHPVFREIRRREEVYRGPYVSQASELLAFAHDGYDLKADFQAERVFETPTRLVGTHTYGDAFFHVSGGESPTWSEDEGDVAAAGRWVAHLLGFENRDRKSGGIIQTPYLS